MNEWELTMLSAAGLGLLTCIQPCPLTTNVAALAWICRWSGSLSRLTLAGVAYLLGRSAAYVAFAALIIYGAVSVPSIAGSVQRWMDVIMGPLVVVAGMFVSGLLRSRRLPGPGFGVVAGQQPWKRSPLGAFLVGIVFAASLCPVSAALYFGTLMPMALHHHSVILLPALYGLGSGMPVVLAAIVVGGGSMATASRLASGNMARIYLPRITGGTLILIGIYLTLKHVFHIIN